MVVSGCCIFTYSAHCSESAPFLLLRHAHDEEIRKKENILPTLSRTRHRTMFGRNRNIFSEWSPSMQHCKMGRGKELKPKRVISQSCSFVQRCILKTSMHPLSDVIPLV